MNVRARRYFQAACLLAAAILLWPPPFWTGASKIVVQLSPFAAICSSLALRTVGLGTGAGLILAAIGIFRRRWFCKYACPVGLLLDGAARIGLRRSRWWMRCPSLGMFFAVLTIAGSVVGYPLLLWLDPLAILSGSFAVRTAGSVLSAFLAIFGLAVLILLSITSGQLWCVRLCPLGGTLDLLASTKTLFQTRLKAAPTEAPHLEPTGVQAHAGRRTFICAAAGIVMGLLARKLGSARGENAPLRPPGAVSESSFAGLCMRCGNCVRSCPAKIIHPDTGQAGVAGLLAPLLRYEKSYCLEDCAACTRVCPSGAIQPLELPDKRRYLIGEALMDGALCVLALGQRDCDACLRACPFDAVRIRWDEEQYIAYPVVDFTKCNGCGACEAACPTFGDKAIRVWRKAD